MKEIINSILDKILNDISLDYNSIYFLIFLACFLGIYFLMFNNKIKEIWLLIGSLIFYCWAGWQAVLIVIFTALTVYIITMRMDSIYKKYDEESKELSPKEKNALLISYKKRTNVYKFIAMFLIFGIWIFVKVCKFNEVDSVLTFNDMFSHKGIIVPLGISYYTLSSFGYILDVYWRKIIPEKNPMRLFSAMIYFPHIVQGPISNYNDLIGQMKKLPAFSYDRVCSGSQLILWGLFKKAIVADRLVILTQTVFDYPEAYAGVEIFMAIIFGAFWMYADFSGCTDIVLGVSEIIGIRLNPNFRQPFFAEDAQGFWARWHMSLSGWTKSYIYLPVAMNPKFMKLTKNMKKKGHERFSSFVKAFVPLVLVWIFTGLWHGTGLDYLAWGLYWCSMMTIGKETEGIRKKAWKLVNVDFEIQGYKIWCRIRTFFVFAIGRMWTVCGSAAGFFILWQRMFSESRLWNLTNNTFFSLGLDRKDYYIAIFGILVMCLVDVLHEKGYNLRQSISKMVLPVRWAIYFVAIFTVIIFGMYGLAVDSAAFAYGAF